MDNLKSAVKSCRFCGGEGILDKVLRAGYQDCQDDPDAFAHFVRCRSCAADGGWGKSVGRAIRLWNMRQSSEEEKSWARMMLGWGLLVGFIVGCMFMAVICGRL